MEHKTPKTYKDLKDANSTLQRPEIEKEKTAYEKRLEKYEKSITDFM